MNKRALGISLGISLITITIISIIIFLIPIKVIRTSDDYPRGVSDITVVYNQRNVLNKQVKGSDVFNTINSIYYWDEKIPITVEYEDDTEIHFFDDRYECNDSSDYIWSMIKRGKTYIGPFDDWSAKYKRDKNGDITEIYYNFVKAEPTTTIAKQLFDKYEEHQYWSFFIFSSENFRVIPVEVERVLFYTAIVIIPFILLSVVTYFILIETIFIKNK